MTRTDPPDILASTVYRDIKVNPSSTCTESLHSSEQCDFHKTGKLEDNLEKINKRHCRSFDYIESLDDPKSRVSSSMEYPVRRRLERHAAHPDVAWTALAQQGHLRFSSPDLFNTRLAPQHGGAEVAVGESARTELKRKARSKSAPRVKSTFTPVPIEVSSPLLRRGREAQRVSQDPHRKSEGSPRREASTYGSSRGPMMNEVHPIKLQPQRGESSRYSPLYVTDCLDQSRPDRQLQQPTTSPHVKCRVDIKPDVSVLQHAARRVNPAAQVSWQRYHSGGSRSLTVPRQISTSRTPTPSDCYSGEYRQAYQYSSSVPSSYTQPVEIPLQGMPSHREYLGRERRAFSIPNVPTKFFYTDDPGRYPSPATVSGTYYSDDQYSIPSQNHTPKMVYTHDPRTRMCHTLPIRPYYTEIEPRHFPAQAVYPRPYSTSEPGPYIVQTPPARAYYREDPRTYPVQPVPTKIFYTNESFTPPPLEHHVPLRAYHTEGRRRPRVSQPQVDDWYGSDGSGYTFHHPSSQLTPQRMRGEPVLTPWYTNHCMEPARLGAEVRPYSRSWDNILNPPHVERQQPVQRGRSYENLLYQGKRALSPEERRQPVVVNLSSSPRRYAALSMSETSLLEKGVSTGGVGMADSGRNAMGRLWIVTPEITITDNDIRPGNLSKTEVRPSSWDVLDSRRDPSPKVPYQDPRSYAEQTAKEKTHNSYSLQQSLEQLDELLADLVIDYKPPTSRRPSEDLLDQLKKLINEDESGPSTKKEGKNPEDQGPLNKQPTCTKISPDPLQDLDSGCDGVQKSTDECSPDQSTDEDDTMMCSNNKCRRTETLFNACLYFKSCHSCYTYYCSRNCRREDWDVHKENCLYGRVGSICRHIIKFCRETLDIHKAFSRIAKVGYLSRGRGVLFLGFPNTGSSNNFLQYGLESLLMSPTYLSLRELDGFKDNLGNYCKELQEAGDEYDPSECFLLNVSIAVSEQVPDQPSPRVQAPTVRKYAKVSLSSSSPERKVLRKESDMETLILTPPPGTSDIDKEGEEGRKSREICFINIQRELRTRGVFLRHEYPQIYQQLCEFVESNKRFTPTTIYPIDKRTGKQFMCMIMAASEPRTLDWVANPHLLDDII
ncbi:hypothetical protein AAFF_G00064020 [Aldrovandia affinis]|uniref:Apical junction molecule ajm1 alpha/beta domain-containing protein n=1 Tax=Aldrovandia affinis TaxID=143900 RepID=A0AAD7WZF2_9TELE|nr:hypothetical protein AAFF_G00064020 [Aldrovandia affinis]